MSSRFLHLLKVVFVASLLTLSTKSAAQSQFISSGIRNHIPTLLEMQTGSSDTMYSSDTVLCLWVHGLDTFSYRPKVRHASLDPVIDLPFDSSSHQELNGQYFDRFWLQRAKGSAPFASGSWTIDFYELGSATPVFSMSFPLYLRSAGVSMGNSQSRVMMFPNPVRTSAILSGDSPKMSITLISEAGNVVREFGAYNGASKVLDFSGLTSGAYQLRLTDSRGVSRMAVILEK